MSFKRRVAAAAGPQSSAGFPLPARGRDRCCSVPRSGTSKLPSSATSGFCTNRRAAFYPNRPTAELFPLLTVEQVRAAGPEAAKTLYVEIGREAATMLAAIALAVAEMPGSGAAFAVAFGVWDIVFYARS